MAETDYPKAKRQKTKIELNPVFLNFLKLEEKKDLVMALAALDTGLSDMTLGVLHVDASNALDDVNFKDSIIQTSAHDLKPGTKGKPKGGVIGDIFLDGLDVLNKYLDLNNPRVPEDKLQREALQKLLLFLTAEEDHKVLFEEKDCEAKWAVTLAQHLLSKLAVENTYTITSYPGFTIQGDSCCLCNARDELVGKIGDTSFGCQKGWHGETDIIMEDVAVSVFPDGFDGDSRSVSSVEVEVSDKFCRKNIRQIISQTVVFSFLQRKLKKEKLKNFLIPGIGIGAKSILVCYYDSENDVLLESRPVEIFDGNALRTRTILFLWLTLNYQHFCSGISQEMKGYKADFIKGLGTNTKIYYDDVVRPLHKPHTSQEELFPWSSEPKPSEFRQNPDLKYVDLHLNVS